MLREPLSIQPRPTRRAELAVILSRISLPIGPSITARMWASSRNRNGRLNTLTSGTTGPIGPSEMRAICSAPICACSIISFSLPSTPPGNIWILYLPLVAASSFLPMFSRATTFG